ncbi:MAG TPA: hypothetical protein VGH28_21610 [Polyangiaceae bacterium]|jgi:hypothetical protein
MKIRGSLAVASMCAFSGLLGCVGDSTPPIDSGVDQSVTDAASDVVNDVSTQDVADGGSGVSCGGGTPALFAEVPDAGPFCSGAGPGNHCALGQHCCFDIDAGTRTCAASCDAGVADIACYSKSECPGGSKCCGNGTPNVGVCPYAVIESFTGTVCASSCTGDQYLECATSAECGAKTCVPAWVLEPDNGATTKIDVGTCL